MSNVQETVLVPSQPGLPNAPLSFVLVPSQPGVHNALLFFSEPRLVRLSLTGEPSVDDDPKDQGPINPTLTAHVTEPQQAVLPAGFLLQLLEQTHPAGSQLGVDGQGTAEGLASLLPPLALLDGRRFRLGAQRQ